VLIIIVLLLIELNFMMKYLAIVLTSVVLHEQVNGYGFLPVGMNRRGLLHRRFDYPSLQNEAPSKYMYIWRLRAQDYDSEIVEVQKQSFLIISYLCLCQMPFRKYMSTMPLSKLC
jgi:hypothetical protein